MCDSSRASGRRRQPVIVQRSCRSGWSVHFSRNTLTSVTLFAKVPEDEEETVIDFNQQQTVIISIFPTDKQNDSAINTQLPQSHSTTVATTITAFVPHQCLQHCHNHHCRRIPTTTTTVSNTTTTAANITTTSTTTIKPNI